MSLCFGDFELDQERRQLLRSGQPVPLEPKAYELLSLLIERRPRVLSRPQIRNVIWPGVFVSESTLNQSVNNVRQALDDDARRPRFIRTAHGFGYAFCGEARDTTDGPSHAGQRTPLELESSPYPGLRAFTEADVEFFFGRDVEVEALWGKVPRQKLLAVIGPSGVGKTSFLSAGVIPSRPQDWAAVCLTPGSSPFFALAHALTSELAGDAEAIEELFRGVEELSRGGESSGIRSAIARWRSRSDHALLVVDQFEELFTLNPVEVQQRFAHLLGRVTEAGVNILLSLRDDFLFRCSEHEGLRSVFLDLTPLRPPSPEALRQALVEPARGRGFAFEEDGLVEEMVEAVRDERGALPLLAFAASRLWDERDRERKLLTRSAYERIGGVAGALAQHAEATLRRLEPQREELVREVFRNLVTAEGTRSAVKREELLSVFGRADRERSDAASQRDARRDAEDVLDALVDARLLTEYEAATDAGVGNSADADGSPGGEVAGGSAVEGSGAAPGAPGLAPERGGRRWIEVVHESLLQAWPRLVMWRARQEEGAVLRDHLKQAARLWDERRRAEDLLWTGRAYGEWRLWRARYSAPLTATEEAFTTAMEAKATRRRRRRRFAVGVAITLALSVAAVTSLLWQRSQTAERQARDEARRAEAGKLLLLGQAQLREDPSAGLAYAAASLERTDSEEARRFAVEVLWQGPTRTQFTSEFTMGARFSPDGQWLARWGLPRVGSLELWPRDGGAPKTFPGEVEAGFAIGPRSGVVMISRRHLEGTRQALHVRSVPDWTLLRTLTFEGHTGFITLAVPRLVTATEIEHRGEWSRALFQSWPLEGGEPTELGHLDSTAAPWWRKVTGDAYGRWLTYMDRAHRIFVVPAERIGTPSARLIGRRERLGLLDFSPDGARLASFDDSGEIRLHPLFGGAPARILHGPRQSGVGVGILGFSHDGSALAAGMDRSVGLWSLARPLEAEPIVLRPGEHLQTNAATFHPSGGWLATVGSTGSIWPLSRQYPRVLRAHDGLVTTVAFDPQGRWLVSGSLDGAVRLWPLREDPGGESRLLFRDETESGVVGVDVDPHGRHVLVGCQSGPVWVVPVVGGPPRRLKALDGQLGRLFSVAFDPRGRLAAANRGLLDGSGSVIRVWDLESDDVRVILDPGDSETRQPRIQFTHDGRIVSGGHGGVRLWDVEAGTYQVLHPGADRFTRTRWSPHICAGNPDAPSEWSCHDLASGRAEALDARSHSPRTISPFTLSPDGATLVSGDAHGVVRVGPRTGGPTHLLLGHEGSVRQVAVSPDGKWAASGGDDGTVRLWPMPDVAERPLHTLPYEVFLEKLRALTNLRAIKDEKSPGGYRVEAGPFPGWKIAPTW